MKRRQKSKTCQESQADVEPLHGEVELNLEEAANLADVHDALQVHAHSNLWIIWVAHSFLFIKMTHAIEMQHS